MSSATEERRHKAKTCWFLRSYTTLVAEPSKASSVFYADFLLLPPLRCAENYIKLSSESKGFIVNTVHVRHCIFCVIVHYCKYSHFLLLLRHALNGLHSLWKKENKSIGKYIFRFAGFLSRS